MDFWIPLQNRVEFNVLGNPPEDGKLYQQDQTWWCLRLHGAARSGSKPRAGSFALAECISDRGLCWVGFADGRGETAGAELRRCQKFSRV